MHSIKINAPFQLENGENITDLVIGYHTYGRLNAKKNNVVWVCHALTANSDVFDWWSGLFGTNKYFDPDKYFIICPNALGSCYGTTGPLTPRKSQRPRLNHFPFVTIKDLANVHELLRKTLGINSINTLLGASMGGQQALEWSINQPLVFQNLILLATNALHSPYGIAFNESQRLAIKADPTFGNGNIHGGRNGLIAARSIALLSYRSYSGYYNTQSESENDKCDQFKSSSYQRYQGEKLAKRFNAYSYYTLSKAMDSHNVGRNKSSVNHALSLIKAKTLVIGISTDLLFPISEQRFLARNIHNCQFYEMHSEYGHDGFLIETDTLEKLIDDFLFNDFKRNKPTVFKNTVKKSELMNLVEK